jgi:heme/copper-type cytochrome/quinol oxidase subunit 2
MSGRRRAAVLVIAVLAAIVGFVLASGSSSEKAVHSSGHAYIYVVGGKPKGGIQTLTYNKGQQVVFTVSSDVADEIHVHGFDLMQDVAKDGNVKFSFPASEQGVYEVELESRGEQIARIEIL